MNARGEGEDGHPRRNRQGRRKKREYFAMREEKKMISGGSTSVFRRPVRTARDDDQRLRKSLPTL